MNATNNTLLEVSRFPGIIDLPMKVRALFAKAWMAENEGKIEEANELLEKAVQAEKENQ